MEPPHGRLPGLHDIVLITGARLKVTLTERDASRDIEVVGNRRGLRALAAICSGLADLTDDELITPANHYHLDENFWGTESGSTPLTVHCREHGWTDTD
jgi:hypothetical protein